jgi:site-specific DNA-cytosine methylase
VIKGALEELGYSFHFQVLDGKHFVPQHRERIVMVGFNKDYFNGKEQFQYPDLPEADHAIREILTDSPDPKYTLSDKLWNYLQAYAIKHQSNGNGFGFGMTNFNLQHSSQAVTEMNKRPDFLFPGPDAYANPRFDENKLVVLASKTTCKDRWRQILNEADRVKTKHLFTLQQGISSNQLAEMYRSNVCLVVPKPYITSFPEEYRSRILTLNDFVGQVMEKQSM